MSSLGCGLQHVPVCRKQVHRLAFQVPNGQSLRRDSAASVASAEAVGGLSVFRLKSSSHAAGSKTVTAVCSRRPHAHRAWGCATVLFFFGLRGSLLKLPAMLSPCTAGRLRLGEVVHDAIWSAGHMERALQSFSRGFLLLRASQSPMSHRRQRVRSAGGWRQFVPTSFLGFEPAPEQFPSHCLLKSP